MADERTDHKYPRILKAVFDRPWAIERSALDVIVDLARMRADGRMLAEDEIRRRIDAAGNGPRNGGSRAASIAVIPLYGVISHRQSLLSATSGGTSIDELGASFRSALNDESVAGIVLDVDSPGGSVDGIEELAAQIRGARGGKPIVAVANSMTASAALWLAAQADELVVTPTGMVGSIGVIAIHEDFSKMDEMAGVKTSIFTSSPYKAEGNEYQPLTDEASAEIQAQVDYFGRMFERSVARGRGVPVDTVRSDYGQGRVFNADQALAAGLVDRIDTLENTVARVAAGKVGDRPAVGASAGVQIINSQTDAEAFGAALAAEASDPTSGAPPERMAQPSLVSPITVEAYRRGYPPPTKELVHG